MPVPLGATTPMRCWGPTVSETRSSTRCGPNDFVTLRATRDAPARAGCDMTTPGTSGGQEAAEMSVAYIATEDTPVRDDATVVSVELGRCPFAVERPIMQHRWESLTFLHWSFPPDAVQRLLPPSLHVEPYEERAWVGLVPFYMRVSLPRTRSVPWFSEFCETNVRTYVRDDAGRSGIWFFSLDAARLGAVVTARTTYRLPYFWSQMSSTRRATRSSTRVSDGGPGRDRRRVTRSSRSATRTRRPSCRNATIS